MSSFSLTFKTPDVVEDSIENSYLSLEEKKKAKEICRRFVRWGELVTLRVDLDDETVSVEENR
jgi:hypothetical protein